ncbi:ATP phosphoribosyltransferase [Helicobacter mustelae]|uniref:ATP phosphoribosyltransferase n=1 Tax=Helicobacter mustelae (strain ATCC 43772 / CCUG 25715 / CIP 103759 / LMG 18044 / NCTC 12198 / R85-136P) TaxID=679897 RepID=D3UI33_HELM1|nr:ATP phosphoribosyltransferase [Helicobacter mustelae]CBG40156.1 putative ATP phosphoribosyltransferase [Helicobacter mustelae 12198]SQH71658.1 ATP phosphoribosyltransferase [Helicobacter mustelae]STP12783.1 ATP phosphoribosyltransferase [Helicobacter mustelae]
MLTIALPKGRIAEDTLRIFSQIFGREFLFDQRKLILKIGDFVFLLVRNQDVPTYVSHHSADLGIVGRDVLEEQRSDVLPLLDLGIGRCKIVVGSEIGKPIDYGKSQIKIATKMPHITQEFFSQKAIAVDVVKLYGSIELAPLVGLADGIVDIVETGLTMQQNNLEIAEVIMESSVFLVANKNSFLAKKRAILSLQEKIKGQVER